MREGAIAQSRGSRGRRRSPRGMVHGSAWSVIGRSGLRGADPCREWADDARFALNSAGPSSRSSPHPVALTLAGCSRGNRRHAQPGSAAFPTRSPSRRLRRRRRAKQIGARRSGRERRGPAGRRADDDHLARSGGCFGVSQPSLLLPSISTAHPTEHPGASKAPSISEGARPPGRSPERRVPSMRVSSPDRGLARSAWRPNVPRPAFACRRGAAWLRSRPDPSRPREEAVGREGRSIRRGSRPSLRSPRASCRPTRSTPPGSDPGWPRSDPCQGERRRR